VSTSVQIESVVVHKEVPNKKAPVKTVRALTKAKTKEDRLSQLSFKTPACQDMSLGTGGIELRN
jgi:hypothetical protein